MPDFKSQNDLKEYDFIAHVRVSDIQKSEKSSSENLIHKMSFEIIELYKGEKINSILVLGSNKLLEGWTSCDLGEEINDEWIIFGFSGSQSNDILTDYCTRSKRIKSSDGFQNLNSPYKITLKQKLQALFNNEIIDKLYNGTRIEYYKNGNKQLEEFYKKNKLNGERKLWYPNGNLQSSQNYKKGIKNGVFKWYSKKGDLIKIEKFKKDINIDTTTTWRKNSLSQLSINVYSDLNNITKEEAIKVLSKKHIWKQYVFDKKGNTIYSVWYLHNGYIYQEYTYDKKTKKSVKKYYNLKGKLKHEIVSIKHIKVSDKEWNDLGELTRLRLYDKKGILIRDNKL